MANALLLGELISVRGFPAVVQAADVRALRGRDDDAAGDFIGGYLVVDDRARHALEATTRALAQTKTGGAFFLSGVFGSGKSHLLGVLTLLAEGSGHAALREANPWLTATNFPRRFSIHFSLDDYDAARFSLEEIFWREARAEWRRCGFDDAALPLPQGASRGEMLLALQEAVAAQGWQGIAVGMDELSLFLGGREHRALQGDAAFLQFLGQAARRWPLCVFAALQKTVEDVGDLEAYSLAQIRDRFVTLPLALTQLPALLQRRLIARNDADGVARLCHESFAELTRAFPRLDFGPQDWDASFPFHPATVALLEGAAARFFSRTRSAVLFFRDALKLNESATARVLPEALFDYWEGEFDGHPDLRPLAAVWREWQAQIGELCRDERDATALRALLKTLLLFKVAGQSPTLTQLANAAAQRCDLPGDGNYLWAKSLLEKLRERGSHLAVEQGEDEFSSRYAVDLGLRVAEAARRHVRLALGQLHDGDARVAAGALACCRNDELPLAELGTGREISVLWRNTARVFDVLVADGQANAALIANRALALAEPGHAADLLLVIAPPFAQLPPEIWREVRDLLDKNGEPRWKNAVLLWTPRAPLREEWELAREAAAHGLLENDPQLLDNRRGRAILAHLKNQAAQREAALARVALRLLREGKIVSGAGQSCEAGEIFTGAGWMPSLEALAEFALARVFPGAESLAPRLRVLTPANTESLCLELLRRPHGEPFFAPSLERVARALAEPLGIARAEAGRWRMSPPCEEISAAISALSASGAPLGHIEAVLAKSVFGLSSEQSQLAVCALLRGGELEAVNARGEALAPSQIGMPLRRAVRTLRPGKLPDEAAWASLRRVVGHLTGEQLGASSFAQQERARALILAWHETTLADAELAKARIHQLRKIFGSGPAQWPRSEELCTAMARLLEQTKPGDNLPQRAALCDDESLFQSLSDWRELAAGLENLLTQLLPAHGALTHPQLTAPPELLAARAALLQRFAAGEALLSDGTLAADAHAWLADYGTVYADWHAAQHDPTGIAPLRDLLHDDTPRAAAQLARLTARDFSGCARPLAQIERATQLQCARCGPPPSGEVLCPQCRLRWGEVLELPSAGEISAAAAQTLEQLRAALQPATVAEILANSARGRALLQWRDGGGALLPLLDDEGLQLLEVALRPRRTVIRSLPTLVGTLKSCKTRREFLRAFTIWLDGGESLGENDEVGLAPND